MPTVMCNILGANALSLGSSSSSAHMPILFKTCASAIAPSDTCLGGLFINLNPTFTPVMPGRIPTKITGTGTDFPGMASTFDAAICQGSAAFGTSPWIDCSSHPPSRNAVINWSTKYDRGSRRSKEYGPLTIGGIVKSYLTPGYLRMASAILRKSSPLMLRGAASFRSAMISSDCARLMLSSYKNSPIVNIGSTTMPIKTKIAATDHFLIL
jgi:hypothetical protein